MADHEFIISNIAQERYQGFKTRKSLYPELEKKMGIPIICYYTSFRYPVMIETSDADMLEALLQSCDLSNGFVLMLSSPGGDGVAAERIINVCRSYSGNGEYQVLVVGRAKSAATMICLGASKIILNKTAELGPVDPILYLGGQSLSVFNIIKSYETLFSKAVKTKGNLEPFLQQLSHYDPRSIEEMRQAMELSGDISVKALKSGMLSKLNKTQIEKAIAMFLTPKATKSHGRPIYAKDAQNCGLTTQTIDLKHDDWKLFYELHVRVNNYVSHNGIGKVIECADNSFQVTHQKKQNEE